MEPACNFNLNITSVFTLFFIKQENAESVERNHFYAALLSPVGNVEASQVVGSITEEV